MEKIGLNGFRDKYKGCKFRYKLRQLRWELRYAWHRAWEGFDDQDIFNLDDQFIDRMIVLLTEYNKYDICLFVDPESPKGKWIDNIKVIFVFHQLVFTINKLAKQCASVIDFAKLSK